MELRWARTAGLRFLKYCITGALNTGVSYAVYAGLIALQASAFAALAAGYAVGMVTSFFLNARWTFSKPTVTWNEAWRFLWVNLCMLALSEFLLAVIRREWIGSPYLAQVVNLIPMTILGYVANRRWVFSSPSVASTFGSRRMRRWLWTAMAVFALQRGYLLLMQKIWHVYSPTWSWTTALVHDYARWDSSWYVQIARIGYVNLKQTAFYPLYPMLIRGLHDATGLSFEASGIAISWISFVWALSLLGMVVESLYGRHTALLSVFLLASFPMAFFFDAVYTESLFMALAMGAVYASYQGRFYTAGLLAGLATLTRNTGLLLVVIMAFDYLRLHNLDLRIWRRQWWTALDKQMGAMFIPPLFLFGYCAWLKVHTGHWFAFMNAEHFWHRVYMAPWETYARTLHFYVFPATTDMSHQYVFWEFSTFTFVVIGLLLGLFSLRRSWTHVGWWLYALAVAWLTSSEPSVNLPDYLVSFPRYVLMLFPVFVYVAAYLKPRILGWAVVIVFASQLSIKAVAFINHIWIA